MHTTEFLVTPKMGLYFQPRPNSLIIFFSLSLFFLISLNSTTDEKLSAYEVLKQFDFPIGILPKGATGYDLNSGTGQFWAYLNGTCSFRLENSYELRYKSTIKGVISNDRLKKLKGVSVKVVLMWLDIVEVKRKADKLEFSVGLMSSHFPVDSFEESPQCGCGFDCVDGFNLNRFVSTS